MQIRARVASVKSTTQGAAHASQLPKGVVLIDFCDGRRYSCELLLEDRMRIGLWIILIAVVAGCRSSRELETGYEPRTLVASPAERRGYYASPFSPEASAADQERMEAFRARRPTR